MNSSGWMGNDLNDQLLVGQVSPGKFDAFSGVAFLHIRVSGLGHSLTRGMKRGQGFRSSRFFFTSARGVVVTGHQQLSFSP